MIFNTVSGAGTGFCVKAYASEQAMLSDAPKEGTIGAVCGMAEHCLCPVQPEMKAGLLWIKTGSGGAVYSEAGARAKVRLFPLKAYACDGLLWQAVPMRVFSGGAWRLPWHVFVQQGLEVNGVNRTGTAKFSVNGLELTTAPNTNSKNAAYAEADLTEFSTLRVCCYTGFTAAQGSYYARAGVTQTANDVNNWVRYVDLKQSAAGTFEFTVDLSGLSGTAFVQVMTYTPSSATSARRLYVTEWRLEP